ncbi:MAG: glutamyl-tRNA reductase [Flavobacteriales bacterium]|nr:glutamyl-tRNA reductase [Flavobacteriales bacterium]
MRLKEIKAIALTHNNLPIEDLGVFHLEESLWKETLSRVKSELALSELLYISTCNRIEFVFTTDQKVNKAFIRKFYSNFFNEKLEIDIDSYIDHSEVFEALDAVDHMFRVASSLDSLVVGEREIITQVRKAYEKCNLLGLTGDRIRLLIKKTVETAKEIYTRTDIAKNPVSVSYLAFSKLKAIGLSSDAKILVLGAGQTNQTMTKFLKKHGYENFHVYNRTLENAKSLAKTVEGKAYGLTDLGEETDFDIVISCTGSDDILIDKDMFSKLTGAGKKVVIDLAVPGDVSRDIQQLDNVTFIEIEGLKKLAAINLEKRKSELDNCFEIISDNLRRFKEIFKERQVELMMRNVPKKVTEIRQNALNNIFAEDIDQMDSKSKEVLDKVLSYIEKKYISVPMKMAKDVILNKDIS